jgi:hypothetical protein
MPPNPASVLSVLEGLPMWRSGRAVDMAMFQFGGRNRRTTRRGQPTEVGDYALHVQCAWRIGQRGRTLVGYRDEVDPESTMLGRRDRLLDEALASSLVVDAVEAPSTGLLVLRFVGEARLEVLPDRKEAYEEDVEHWRFLSPGSEVPHLVYHSTGFELE